MRTSVRSSLLLLAGLAVLPAAGKADGSVTGARRIVAPLVSKITFDTAGLFQAAQPALIVGQVTDVWTRLPIVGASVTMDRGGLSTITTDEGRYILSGVPTGYVRITVRAPGYVTQVKRVKLLADRFTMADFALTTVTPPPSADAPAASGAGTTTFILR